MSISIGKLTKELKLKHHELHKWEERGWLGADPVLKDPKNNNQRIYNEEQVERIKYIQKIIEEQRKEGIRRADFQDVEEKLLERFGGEVIERKDVPAHYANPEEMFQMILKKIDEKMDKKFDEVKDIIVNNQKMQLPASVDYSSEFEAAKKREDKLLEIIGELKEVVVQQGKEISELKQTVKEPKKKWWQF